MQASPTNKEVFSSIASANAAAVAAARLRRKYRRKSKPGGVRQADIEAMIKRLKLEAKPIRRYIGMALDHNLSHLTVGKLKAAIQKLAYERRQLRKMLR